VVRHEVACVAVVLENKIQPAVLPAVTLPRRASPEPPTGARDGGVRSPGDKAATPPSVPPDRGDERGAAAEASISEEPGAGKPHAGICAGTVG
jgi:hypothetical protein